MKKVSAVDAFKCAVNGHEWNWTNSADYHDARMVCRICGQRKNDSISDVLGYWGKKWTESEINEGGAK